MNTSVTNIDATDPRARAHDEEVRAIGTLSKELHVPEPEVADVYRREFDRLTRHSRITTFVAVLALRNTRSILKESHLHG